MRYSFVGKNPGDALLSRMLKGGLDATVAGYREDEVFVTVVEGEEWADEDAWVRAIEEHYACVFDDATE
ncbi:hypothetical protein LCGC14_2835630 [marine sediment metagenome]|uniref:Uncharacterized protein n=1 Tax=marine sediment metagenome TaxID=412755 RepID=A0A0F9AL54_9ZZZZ